MYPPGFEPRTFAALITTHVTTQPFGHKDFQTIRNEVPTVSWGRPRHPKQTQTAPTLLSTQPPQPSNDHNHRWHHHHNHHHHHPATTTMTTTTTATTTTGRATTTTKTGQQGAKTNRG